LIRDWLGNSSPPAPRGIGDDAAVLPSPVSGHLLFASDLVVWNRHFDFSTEPEAVGAKLLKRNLSDLAATGGHPGHAMVALACGGDLSLNWLERFYRGLASEALRSSCEINGGDLSSADSGTFVASLSIIGTSDRPLLRPGGEAGSWIWVTGSLGGSILGHHLQFTPRVEEGVWLSGRTEVLAAMDITDGLAIDLPFMVPEGLQARLDLSYVPVSDAARASAQDSGKPAVWHALNDGEDYELAIITAASTDTDQFEKEWRKNFPQTPIAPLGILRPVPDTGPLPKVADLDGNELVDSEGFDHFGER